MGTYVNRENLFEQHSRVTAEERRTVLGQSGGVIWLTGLSGSGKSTLAQALEKRLMELGHPAFILDGDNIRRRLNADLGFSDADRSENIRRVAAVSALLADAGVLCISSFITPFRADRDLARETVGSERFALVHISTPLEECERRDPKGLYRKARDGKIPDFTGIGSPYETPSEADLELDTTALSTEDGLQQLLAMIRKKGFM